jgi:DNA polymerase-3 subunit delta'
MSDDAAIPEPDAVEGAPHPRRTLALYGQSAAEADFLTAWQSGRMHHAWLITGPRGVGKATLAWKIARFLLAVRAEADGLFGAAAAPPATLDLSADDPIWRRTSALSEPRLFLCRRPWDDKAGRLKQDITVDEVRKLKGFFTLSATDGGHRVALVDCADEMNQSAANALLKILEEPPAKTTILLVSHRPQRLLPTIRSRCRVLRCAALPPADLDAALAGAGFQAGDAAEALAVLAAGSVGEAIRLLSAGGVEDYGRLVRLVAEAPRMPRPTAIALAEGCSGRAAEARYDLTLRLIDLLLHRLARIGAAGGLPAEAVPGEVGTLARLSPDAHAARGWATLAETLGARARHARAVNLDPAGVILDMLLKIDQTAGDVRAA